MVLVPYDNNSAMAHFNIIKINLFGKYYRQTCELIKKRMSNNLSLADYKYNLNNLVKLKMRLEQDDIIFGNKTLYILYDSQQ
jgi:hypothetical protein